jgi:hypothetical protein
MAIHHRDGRIAGLGGAGGTMIGDGSRADGSGATGAVVAGAQGGKVTGFGASKTGIMLG